LQQHHYVQFLTGAANKGKCDVLMNLRQCLDVENTVQPGNPNGVKSSITFLMYRNPNRGEIRPKISTMPRQKSEAAAILDLYKLVVEKKRLQQELQTLEQRCQQINRRLAGLDQQIASVEHNVQHLRDQEGNHLPEAESTATLSVSLPEDFETLFLEY
jgi:hypothetical protein